MSHPANGATLYASKPTPNSYRTIKVLATAAFNGVTLQLPNVFTFGVDNLKKQYLKKFPLGQTPGLELKDGFTLYQSDAITQYISTDAFVRKDCPKAYAQVLQYVNWASHEINAAQTTLCYPCLGLTQPDKAKAPVATKKLEKYLNILNDLCENNTFLVGERITLADVTVASELILPLKFIVEPSTLAKYPHLKRWFITMVNQPAFKQYVGEYEFCVKAKPFDAKRYNELNGSNKKETNKASAKPAAAAEPPKKKDPFASLPPSNFSLDEFKKIEANNDAKTVALPHLWKKFDNEGFSFWSCEYKYNDELTLGFMAKNFIRNTLESLRCISKHLYGSFFLIGTEKNYKIKGIFLQRGQELIFNLDTEALFDTDVFHLHKLDINKAEDKATIETFILKGDSIDGVPVEETLQLR